MTETSRKVWQKPASREEFLLLFLRAYRIIRKKPWEAACCPVLMDPRMREEEEREMNRKVRWVVQTGLMLAVLVALQAATKPLGQMVTGSCVNMVLALSAMLCGVGSGAVVALLSPVLAFLLGIAANAVTVPAIMVGNLAFVAVLSLPGLLGKDAPAIRGIAWLAGAAGKFALLYLAVNKIICGIAAQPLLSSGVLKEKMLTALPVTFGVSQLITALIGGGIAIILYYPLRRAIRADRKNANS